MTFYRRAKRDKQHTPILNALRALPGCCVVDLCAVGGGVPDLLAAYKGVTLFLEVKSADTAYGKASLQGKTGRAGTHGESITRQKEFKDKWERAHGCSIVTVTDVPGALQVLGIGT